MMYRTDSTSSFLLLFLYRQLLKLAKWAFPENTFLTYYNLNNKIIDFLTDNSKYKQNKITPVTRIIIKDDNEIKKYKKIACIILSWNISNLIIKKIKKLNKKAKFIYT